MNKNVLTLLGCSGSLALLLGVADLVLADTAPNVSTVSETANSLDITFSAPQAPTTSQNVVPSRAVKPQYANIDAASDTIGDLAIAKFRCDCNACRAAVVQLLQTGQLSL